MGGDKSGRGLRQFSMKGICYSFCCVAFHLKKDLLMLQVNFHCFLL